jgi:hypothetical protein
MNVKKLIAAKDFKDKHGKDHKRGDRIEGVDPDYGQELIRRGEATEDPQATQLPAESGKAEPK